MLCGSEELRLLFPHCATGLVYLDHAAVSPLSTRVVAAMEEHLRHRSEGEVNTYGRDLKEVMECRVLVKRLINAESAERIAFCMNTSDALNVIAAGLNLKAGDRIILNDWEFPSNVYPFLNLRSKGVEIDILKTEHGIVTAEMVENAITAHGDNVKAVSISAVQFLSGYKADLAAIGAVCKRQGVVFIVDGIQALGASPVDVQAMGIDALAASAHKWLMAPHGIAMLYVSEALQARLQQAHVGWLSVQTPWDFFQYDQPLAASARRYENGTMNFIGASGFKASLELLLAMGVENIHRHLLKLTERLTTGLRGMDGVVSVIALSDADRAGITSAKLHDTTTTVSDAVHKHLMEANVTISLREGYLRYAPHLYNTAAEVDAALEATREAFTNVAAETL